MNSFEKFKEKKGLLEFFFLASQKNEKLMMMVKYQTVT